MDRSPGKSTPIRGLHFDGIEARYPGIGRIDLGSWFSGCRGGEVSFSWGTWPVSCVVSVYPEEESPLFFFFFFPHPRVILSIPTLLEDKVNILNIL